MNTPALPQGTSIIYSASPAIQVRARVLTDHRDGDVTVEPMFFIEDGRDATGYIGGRVSTARATLSRSQAV